MAAMHTDVSWLRSPGPFITVPSSPSELPPKPSSGLRCKSPCYIHDWWPCLLCSGRCGKYFGSAPYLGPMLSLERESR